MEVFYDEDGRDGGSMFACCCSDCCLLLVSVISLLSSIYGDMTVWPNFANSYRMHFCRCVSLGITIFAPPGHSFTIFAGLSSSFRI